MDRDTIQEYASRCKMMLDKTAVAWSVPVLVVLLGLSSFALGRLSVLESARPAVSVREAAMAAAVAPLQQGGMIVGSWSGTTYYFPWCAGAERIALAHRRWFQSESAARGAGYAPAKNCKGLTGE